MTPAALLLTQTAVYSLMLKLMGTLAYILLPFLLAAMSAGLVVSIGQGGFSFSMEKLSFNPDKLNPISGLKKMFNVDSLAEIVKSLLKLAIVALCSLPYPPQ